MEQVWLRSPKGDVKQVDAAPEALTLLMVAGWHQVKPGTVIAAAPGTVLMESPAGEIQEEAAGSPSIPLLMAQGWHEVPPQKPSGSK